MNLAIDGNLMSESSCGSYSIAQIPLDNLLTDSVNLLSSVCFIFLTYHN